MHKERKKNEGKNSTAKKYSNSIIIIKNFLVLVLVPCPLLFHILLFIVLVCGVPKLQPETKKSISSLNFRNENFTIIIFLFFLSVFSLLLIFGYSKMTIIIFRFGSTNEYLLKERKKEKYVN